MSISSLIVPPQPECQPYFPELDLSWPDILSLDLCPTPRRHLADLDFSRQYPVSLTTAEYAKDYADQNLEAWEEPRQAWQAYAPATALRSTPSTTSSQSVCSSPKTKTITPPASITSEERGTRMSAARVERLRHAPRERPSVREKGRWKCPECPETFPKALLLDAHAKESRHRAYRCEDCTKTYVRQSTLARHWGAAHGPGTGYSCVYCRDVDHAKSFRRKDHLRQHLREVHCRFDNAEMERGRR